MSNKFLLSIVADYGPVSDMAFSEVKQRLYSLCGERILGDDCISVPPFDTLATGFVLAQKAINSEMGERHKFYVNTAPRKDDLKPRDKCAGEALAYVRLKNGVEIVAVNSRYSLSFVKEAAEEIRHINCDTAGSQFRSRDIFPQAFQTIINGDTSIIGQDISGDIPDFPKGRLCYTDGYGNLKLSVTDDEIKDMGGQDASFSLNGFFHSVRVCGGIFAVRDGALCLAPGSSGWTLPNGKTYRFVECSLRGGSAAEMFKNPRGDSRVKIKVLSENDGAQEDAA